MDKKTPMLDPKKKNEQDIEGQDYPGASNSKPDATKKPSKENPEAVPESNDPAGYGEKGTTKKSPYKKK